MKFYATAFLALAALVVVVPSAAQTPAPAAPANLEVVGLTQTSITLAWGPSVPGAFTVLDGGRNWVTAGWGASQDTRSAVSYRVWKDGELVGQVLTPEYRFHTHPKVDSFRICVQAINASGQASPQGCGTITRL